jgi:soluble lytic murein transglycosylase-like protein
MKWTMNMSNSRTAKSFNRVCLILLVFSCIHCMNVLLSAEARIYSYVNEKGKIVYTNEPAISIKESAPDEKKIAMYQNVINNIANRFQVDSKLVHAIIIAESNYNPRAVSKKGAKGIMQLMPGTAKRYGVTRIFDPMDNIIGGVKYLKDLLIIFDGDLRYALASYNAGENMVKYYNGVPPFEETKAYVEKVLDLYGKAGGRRTAYKYWDLSDNIHYSLEKPSEGSYKQITTINLIN